jgi:hypothetical protein
MLKKVIRRLLFWAKFNVFPVSARTQALAAGANKNLPSLRVTITGVKQQSLGFQDGEG